MYTFLTSVTHFNNRRSPFSDASRYKRRFYLSRHSTRITKTEWHLCQLNSQYGIIGELHRDKVRPENCRKKKKKKINVISLRKDNRNSVSNRDRFRYPEKAGRNVALLSCAASRIRNLVNSPETVNSGTFDSRSLLYHSPSDQSDPNHGCHEPTLLRTNGPVVARTYKRRSARPNKSHAAASQNRTRHFKLDHQRKNELRDR